MLKFLDASCSFLSCGDVGPAVGGASIKHLSLAESHRDEHWILVGVAAREVVMTWILRYPDCCHIPAML